jgi:glutathione S-transferase
MGKIPILRDGELVVPDSSVICAYLEKKYPSPALYPADPADFAKALFLEEYADTAMFSVLSPVLFERVVKPRVFQQAPDEARVAEQLEKLPPVLDYLESQLPEAGATLLARFCIADAALGAHLGTLTLSGVSIDTARWPRVERYYQALRGRPSFEAATPG